MSHLKCFGTSQLEFEMVDLYKNKVKFTWKWALFYPLTGAFICKQGTLATFFTVYIIQNTCKYWNEQDRLAKIIWYDNSLF